MSERKLAAGMTKRMLDWLKPAGVEVATGVGELAAERIFLSNLQRGQKGLVAEAEAVGMPRVAAPASTAKRRATSPATALKAAGAKLGVR